MSHYQETILYQETISGALISTKQNKKSKENHYREWKNSVLDLKQNSLEPDRADCATQRAGVLHTCVPHGNLPVKIAERRDIT